MRIKVSYVTVVSSLLAGALGCGLISKDILRTTFNLPAKTYSFDTAAWNLPMGDIPAVPCGDGQLVADCCNPPAPLPAVDCSVNSFACDNNVCALHIPVSVSQVMDLKKEVPALSSFSNQSLIDVAITQIKYAYSSSMNVDLPPVDLYLAPEGVTSASDPSAKKFGRTKTIPAGATGDDTVDLDPSGGAAFTDYAHHFGTPFNFIAATTVVIPSGSPIPSGRVNIIVQGTATAGI
jgi:hypothetical protein